MAVLEWDKMGERLYETGVNKGVLFPMRNGQYQNGVAWNGLISVTETPSGAEDSRIYADNMNYLTLKSAEEFGGSLECYMYPDEWKACDGSTEIADGVSVGQQKREKFGLVYVTKIGNDTDGDDFGYKIHIVYNCSATPSERNYTTVNDSPEAIQMSYTYTSTPVNVKGKKPTSIVTIDSKKIESDKLKKIEDKLFGSESGESTMLLPDEIVTLIS